MMQDGKLRWMSITVLIWMLAGGVISLHEYFFLANYEGVVHTIPMEEYSLSRNTIAAIIWGFLGGLAYVVMEVWFFDRLSRKPFITAVGIKISIYAMVLVVLNVCISAIYNSIFLQLPIWHSAVWIEVNDFITSLAFWHPLTPFVLLSILSSLLLHLSERLGGNVLWKLLTGRYHHPKEEQRIFMFLDLNASTSIAEKLGHKRFYHFINDFFHDISAGIVHNKGEVVEYVGDQVVITWTIESGSTNARCLRCFVDFENYILSKHAYYEATYGIIPQFKAAVHAGDVMIGEVGRLKKTVKFSGDVLNTTARIEKICGQIGAKLAISQAVVQHIGLSPYPLEKVSNVQLKGKEKGLDIYKVAV